MWVTLSSKDSPAVFQVLKQDFEEQRVTTLRLTKMASEEYKGDMRLQ